MAARSGWREFRKVEIPELLYGTAWKAERTQELTALALRAGFVGIDTANQLKHYVEADVGAAVASALAETGRPREELFLQTKFTSVEGQDHRLPYATTADVGTQVEQSFESSLSHLRTSYIDSYLLHAPSSRNGLNARDWQAWRAMEALERAGKTRFIGISNVSRAQLGSLVDGAIVPPAFVQNRCYARTGWDRDVRGFCASHGIVYQGFSLLTANRAELASAAIVEMARRTDRTAAELVFRFALHIGIQPLTGTSQLEHMRLDLRCMDFELAPADLTTLERIGH